jgi:hypothetical protein
MDTSSDKNRSVAQANRAPLDPRFEFAFACPVLRNSGVEPVPLGKKVALPILPWAT